MAANTLKLVCKGFGASAALGEQHGPLPDNRVALISSEPLETTAKKTLWTTRGKSELQ
jgi:hypothetical protein